jgi:hypothetical protein
LKTSTHALTSGGLALFQGSEWSAKGERIRAARVGHNAEIATIRWRFRSQGKRTHASDEGGQQLYRLAQLSYADDHPGNRIPALRFAFRVTAASESTSTRR